MSTFALDIGKFAAQAKENAQQVVRKVSTDVLSRVVLRTPVDTGRARANWVTTYGNPSPVIRNTVDRSGEGTILRGRGTIGRATPGADIYIMNNLPYAERLEYGWSKQAPAGMVRITVAEFQTLVNAAVREAAK